MRTDPKNQHNLRAVDREKHTQLRQKGLKNQQFTERYYEYREVVDNIKLDGGYGTRKKNKTEHNQGYNQFGRNIGRDDKEIDLSEAKITFEIEKQHLEKQMKYLEFLDKKGELYDAIMNI